MSLPRFVAVLFPLFMWLAVVCEERRVTDLVVAASRPSGSGCSPRSTRAGTGSRDARAVLLDALGTLVELQPPAPRLRRLLASPASR